MTSFKIKYLILGAAFGFFLMGTFVAGGLVDRVWGLRVLDKVAPVSFIVDEESVITQVVERTAPSVVTVSVNRETIVGGGFFNIQPQKRKIEQNIGTGFVVDGGQNLVVTNKHVVADIHSEYKVITQEDKVLAVTNIYRDPVNDLAILKVKGESLPALELGDSARLKVGQKAIAIGTALGEFRHTVTVGVISGLGRGITAGSPLEGFVERLDDVIQTDAAVNPGNSGGPLLNSVGEVIGVNVAVSAVGENIGFAIPINVVKESLNNFHSTGEFARAFLGVRYQMISKQAAILNEVPQGAYIREIIENSPAQKAGLEVGDIITRLDKQRLEENDNNSLLKIISRKKTGDKLELEIWREGKKLTLKATLETRE